MIRFFKLIFVGFRFFFYLFTYNGKLRYAKKLEKEGKIAERDTFVEGCVSEWGQYLVGLTKSEVEIRGAEKIPEGSVVFVGNHQSYFDIPVMLGYFKKRFAFVAKVELKKVPMLSKWMEIMQCTFLDRKNPRNSFERQVKLSTGILLSEVGFAENLLSAKTSGPDGLRRRGTLPSNPSRSLSLFFSLSLKPTGRQITP